MNGRGLIFMQSLITYANRDSYKDLITETTVFLLSLTENYDVIVITN